MKKRAIIIHGWEGTPKNEWLPWVGKQLEANGWKVEIPQLPNTMNPKLNEWMDALISLSPDENTMLVGHSLANALILKYLERPEIKVKGAVLVAAWNWLIEAAKDHHITFYDTDFDYDTIKKKSLPLTIVNSSNDPWVDFERSKLMAEKLNAKFIGVENAGHFMERDGYKEFPQLVNIIEEDFKYV